MASAAILDEAELDRLLCTLPREYAIGALDGSRLVVGPAGGFVLSLMGEDLDADTYRLLQLTSATRVALSDHLPWVPFLDALLVAPVAGAHHHRDVTVVPGDLLLDVLHDGHQPLDRATMDRVFVLLAERRLTPAWRLLGGAEALEPIGRDVDATAPEVVTPG